jgi:hypothetical protein
MKISLLIISLISLCLISCTTKPSDQWKPSPAYPIDSAEFRNATPSKFHNLTPGITEEVVLKSIGEPTSKSDFYAAGKLGHPPVGKRYAYLLDEGGVVWVDFDLDMQVTGIFWRDRD